MKNAFNWKFAFGVLLVGLFLVGTLIYNFFWMDTAISSSGHATMSNGRTDIPDGSWVSFRWLILVAILLLVVLGGLYLVFGSQPKAVYANGDPSGLLEVCRWCGEDVSETWKICPNCGYDLSWVKGGSSRVQDI